MGAFVYQGGSQLPAVAKNFQFVSIAFHCFALAGHMPEVDLTLYLCGFSNVFKVVLPPGIELGYAV